MKIVRVILISLSAVLASVGAEANSGDFSGGVAIGTGYAGVDTAPTNGLIIQGNVGIGTTNPTNALSDYGDGGNGVGPGVFGIVGTNSGSGAAHFVWASSAIDRNLVAGAAFVHLLGEDTSTNNSGYIGFHYIGSGSSSNYLTFGFYGTDNLEVLTASGAVGIGTATPRGGALLDVNGSVRVATFAAGSSTTVCQNANVLSSCTSALRFKENVRPAELGLREVLEMKPVLFEQRDHKDNWEKHDFGFIAEDMEKINPLFVTYDDQGRINGVRYMQLTAVNAKAIQEMQTEIDELKRTIEELKHQQ